MNRNEIEEKVKKILINCLDLQKSISEIEGNDLINEFSINSIDAISIFISIENTFGISIEDNDLSAELIRTLNSIVDYIRKKMESTLS